MMRPSAPKWGSAPKMRPEWLARSATAAEALARVSSTYRPTQSHRPARLSTRRSPTYCAICRSMARHYSWTFKHTPIPVQTMPPNKPFMR